MKITELQTALSQGQFKEQFELLYGSEQIVYQLDRYASLLRKAQERYGDAEAHLFSAPGRTEIGGNHTDHQLGKVIAASIHLDCVAVVIETDDNIVRYASDEFTVKDVDLNDLTIHEEEKNSTEALIRGIAAGLKQRGYNIGGFSCYAESDVISGGGMSSSACFEVLIGKIQSALYNDDQVSAEEIAMIGQYAENVYFMKPCGLMDQMACSVGSFAAIDFADPKAPVVRKVAFDPASFGYDLILTDVKASHADLSDEYGLVPSEMKAVAKVLGYDVLSRTSLNELLAHVKEIREQCGDRAFLRAYHFLNETNRAALEAEALEKKDMDTFLRLVRESGQSSYMYLQNINVPGSTKQQPVAVGLALSESVVGTDGAYRVHGGGFAGTIQAFVKQENREQYISLMESVYGKNCCYVLRIRQIGGFMIA